MQAGLLPNPAVPDPGPTDLASGMDLRITMLDGDLGAVVAPCGTPAAPTVDAFCWPPCVVCGAEEPSL
jgi:hypothetical protein